jgi:hypothetical protein
VLLTPPCIAYTPESLALSPFVLRDKEISPSLEECLPRLRKEAKNLLERILSGLSGFQERDYHECGKRIFS